MPDSFDLQVPLDVNQTSPKSTASNHFSDDRDLPSTSRMYSFNNLKVDPFLAIEASLTSVKCGIYQGIGYYIRNSTGCRVQVYHATSLRRAVSAGFTGGAIFTLLYLIHPRWKESLLAQPHGAVENISTFEWFENFAAEMMHSAMAGGLGMFVVGYGEIDEILLASLDGLSGPLVIYSVLYLVLRLGLAAISTFVRQKL